MTADQEPDMAFLFAGLLGIDPGIARIWADRHRDEMDDQITKLGVALLRDGFDPELRKMRLAFTLLHLAELEAKATPGPWAFYCDDDPAIPERLDRRNTVCEFSRKHTHGKVWTTADIDPYRSDSALHDAVLVVAIRNALPGLLAHLAGED